MTVPGPARWGLMLLTLGALLASSACASVPTWQRGRLQSRVMNEVAPPLEEAMTQHVFSVREAMAGGTGAGGASCGCN